MQQIASQCTSCGAFPRRSLHHEEGYQSSVLLERLRTTNFAATDEEISHIRKTILPTVSDDISSIESKLASLREVITSMEEERERLINVQKRYSNLVSLHRTLPSEIWSEVFRYTLPGDFITNAFDASRPMWQLSHVCQRWRNVALSRRSFWSTINLRFPKAAQKEADVQRLETVIQRSRQGPLNVSLISCYSPTLSSNPSVLKCILDIVLAESHRWRKLHLADDARSLNMLYVPLHNRLPRLESLSLYVTQLEHSAVSAFENCPRLTKLSLGGEVVKLPWDQVTELDLFCMELDDSEEKRRECIRLIGQCPSLVTLSTPSWDPEDDEDEDESAYTPITCLNLSKLDATSVPVINALTLPCLREVFFHPEPATADYALSSFKQLLIRSNCLSALTSLSLADVPLAADCTLHSILSQTHSLAFLGLAVTVGEFKDYETDVQQLVTIVKSLDLIPAKTVTFLPLLSSLDIQIHNHREPFNLLCFGPVGSLASMLKARWKGDDTVRLRTCHFAVRARHVDLNRKPGIYRGDTCFVPHIFTDTERLIFDALVDDGMDLTIRVTSDLTESVGGNDVDFAVSR